MTGTNADGNRLEGNFEAVGPGNRTRGRYSKSVIDRATRPGHACPTKLLWTKVRYAIVRTLQETTLADLVLAPMLADGPMLPGAWIDTQTQTLTTGA
jgi:hypothetical protein